MNETEVLGIDINIKGHTKNILLLACLHSI